MALLLGVDMTHITANARTNGAGYAVSELDVHNLRVENIHGAAEKHWAAPVELRGQRKLIHYVDHRSASLLAANLAGDIGWNTVVHVVVNAIGKIEFWHNGMRYMASGNKVHKTHYTQRQLSDLR